MSDKEITIKDKIEEFNEKYKNYSFLNNIQMYSEYKYDL